jgi:hypothetical protein
VCFTDKQVDFMQGDYLLMAKKRKIPEKYQAWIDAATGLIE